MDAQKQIAQLSQSNGFDSFGATLKELGFYPLKPAKLDIFQINVGKLCNMTCQHCHVEAGPDRTENMTRFTLEQCLAAIQKTGASTVDLTGGAPEMNPHLAWFIEEVSKLGKRVIVRSNLTVLLVPKYAKFIDLFAKHGVEVVASVPDYTEAKTDKQRGQQTFKRSIQAIQKLNALGYGKPDTGLVLNLVHNPVGAFLPGGQEALEHEYKTRLFADHGIVFNHLFCITNMPISRYLEYLNQTENYEDYMTDLVNAFNPAAVENVMCRNTLSVGWDGQLYDCDFNQMLELPLKGVKTVAELNETSLAQREIVINNHCYGCTAGAGSSCQGSLE